MPWKDEKTWPYIQDLILSEVSYLGTVDRIAELKAIEKRSWDIDEALRQLEGAPDQDLKVMTIWIDRLKDMGIDFLNDPRIPKIRQDLLSGLANKIETQRKEIYLRVLDITSQEQLEKVLAADKALDIKRESILNLATNDCIWIAKIAAIGKVG
jgi:hypothetical protein